MMLCPVTGAGALGGFPPCWHGWQLDLWPLLLCRWLLACWAGASCSRAGMRNRCLTLLPSSATSCFLTQALVRIRSGGPGHENAVLHETLHSQIHCACTL